MEAPRTHRGQLPGGSGKDRAPPKETFQSESDSEDESQAEDGEDYDVESITDHSSNEHIIALDHCRQHNSTYAFQIADAEVHRCSIRINETGTGPTCSCSVEGTCKHIQWLLNKLEQTRKDTMSVVPRPYEIISAKGFRNVCEELQWELREGPDSDSEEPQWKIRKDYAVTAPGHQTRGLLKERVRVVRDILATFSEFPTDDFRDDIFGKPDDFAVGKVLVPRDLEATVSRLLVLNDDMFGHFKTLVKPDIRASDYFQKMAVKAQTTCALLDKYCDRGPTEVGGNFDLIWCAKTLADIVTAIHTNVIARQPLRSSSREEAARALISILRMVVKQRNHDAYQNMKWKRNRAHGEPQIDRNLYLRLIGSTARVNPAGGTFVIKILQDLPEARRFVEDLEEIYNLLKTVGWSAPQSYLDKLESLITQLKGGSGPSPSSGSGSSSVKRPASSLDRNAKRMK